MSIEQDELGDEKLKQMEEEADVLLKQSLESDSGQDDADPPKESDPLKDLDETPVEDEPSAQSEDESEAAPDDPPQPADSEAADSESEEEAGDGLDGLTLKNAEERIRNAQARMHKASQEASEAKREISTLNDQIQTLKGEIEALQRQNSTPESRETATESGDPLDELVGEYPDIAGPLVRQIRVLQQSLQSDQEQRAKADADAIHYQKILKAHPDAYEIRDSDDFLGWLERQPPLFRRAFDQGASEDVIHLLSSYKQAVGRVEAEPVHRIDTKPKRLEEGRKIADPPTPRSRRPVQTLGRPRFTREQIANMSPSEFEKHEEEIDAAVREGRVA